MNVLFKLLLPAALCAATLPACSDDPENKPEPAPENRPVQFADPVLEARLKAVEPAIDADGDGVITRGEALAVTALDFSFETPDEAEGAERIADISGLEHFLNLETLGLRYHAITDATPLEGLSKMCELNLGGNRVASFDPTGMPDLEDLRLFDATIRTIDLTQNKALRALYMQRVQVPTLVLTDLPALEEVYLNNGALTSLEVAGLPQLTRLDVVENALTTLSVTDCPALSQLHANGNRLTGVTLSELPKLMILNLYGNRLASIEVSHLPFLLQLFLFDNRLTEIDLTQNAPLRQVYLSNNLLTVADFSGNDMLELIELENTPTLETIDLKNGFYDEWNEYMIVEGNTGLKKVICDPGAEVTHLQNIFRNRPDVAIVTE